MKVIGITGGIGSGKSVALDMLEKDFGVKVLYADKVGHLAMDKDSPSYFQMIETFGEQIVDADGTINRNVLSDMLLSSEELLQKQNSIVHPFVIDYIKQRLEEWNREGAEMAAVESAILVQSGCQSLCDEVWLVTATEEVRIQRLMENRGYSFDKARAFINSQQPEAAYRESCDRVIQNDEDINKLYKQIKKSIEHLQAM